MPFIKQYSIILLTSTYTAWSLLLGSAHDPPMLPQVSTVVLLARTPTVTTQCKLMKGNWQLRQALISNPLQAIPRVTGGGRCRELTHAC